MKQWIEASDVEFEATRSGGPGGQNANMRSTAVRLRATISDLRLTDEQKRWIREYLPPKNQVGDDGLMVENSEGRSQHENRKRALKQVNREIDRAIQQGKQARKKQKRARRVTKKRGGSGGSREDIHEAMQKKLRSETTDELLEQAYEEDPGLSEDDESDADSS